MPTDTILTTQSAHQRRRSSTDWWMRKLLRLTLCATIKHRIVVDEQVFATCLDASVSVASWPCAINVPSLFIGLMHIATSSPGRSTPLQPSVGSSRVAFGRFTGLTIRPSEGSLSSLPDLRKDPYRRSISPPSLDISSCQRDRLPCPNEQNGRTRPLPSPFQGEGLPAVLFVGSKAPFKRIPPIAHSRWTCPFHVASHIPPWLASRICAIPAEEILPLRMTSDEGSLHLRTQGRTPPLAPFKGLRVTFGRFGPLARRPSEGYGLCVPAGQRS